MSMRTTNDLMRIAAAGGGMELDLGAFPVDDILRIAAAASNKPGTRLVLYNIGALALNDLLRIAAAGSGAVVFRDI